MQYMVFDDVNGQKVTVEVTKVYEQIHTYLGWPATVWAELRRISQVATGETFPTVQQVREAFKEKEKSC